MAEITPPKDLFEQRSSPPRLRPLDCGNNQLTYLPPLSLPPRVRPSNFGNKNSPPVSY